MTDRIWGGRLQAFWIWSLDLGIPLLVKLDANN
jgi:hypothetical protein